MAATKPGKARDLRAVEDILHHLISQANAATR
jgi:hypothetical protein